MVAKAKTDVPTVPTKAEPTTVYVTRSVQVRESGAVDEKTKTTESVVAVHKFATEPASAYVEIPIKLSKNYQSMGITVGVRRPCYAEELPDALEEAYQMALARVKQELPDLRKVLEKLA